MTSQNNWTIALLMAAVTGLAQAAQSDFLGRLADNTPSTACTASGANKCTTFYNPALNITILNNWRAAFGPWTPDGSGGETVQFFAEQAGFRATGLTGWVLPTGDGNQGAGPLNQYRAIWNQVGQSFQGLSSQFDNVSASDWAFANSTYQPLPQWVVWAFRAGDGAQDGLTGLTYAVAVRPGDIATAVPEPGAMALMGLGLATLIVAIRRR